MTISERRFLPLWNIKKKQYYEGKKPVELGGGGGCGEGRTSKFDSPT